MNQQQKLADPRKANDSAATPKTTESNRAEAKRSGVSSNGDTPPEVRRPRDISWESLTQASIILTGFVVAIVALSLGRSVIMPVLAATIMGITMRPVQTFAEGYKIPPAVTAFVLVAVLFAALYAAITMVAGPIAEWIPKAPELGGSLKEKFRWLDRPMAVWREIKTAMGDTSGGGQTIALESVLPALAQGTVQIVTPAVSEFLVFFGTLLFFLVGNNTLRRQLITAFSGRRARLRVVRIWNDIEHDLVTYVGTVSIINIGVGIVTTLMLYALGFPNPIMFGVLAFALNFIPYIGPAIIVLILFTVGLINMPSIGSAAIAPLLFVVMTTVEGHVITPSVIGRRLTLSPFLVFLALAFWTWLWGPLGAFLATPLLIVSLVVIGHLFPREDEVELPK